LAASQCPCTQALLSATPTVDAALRRERILLKGELPSPLALSSGCTFHTRCPWAEARRLAEPQLVALGPQRVACPIAAERA
jgi:dipeptide transport system ATP-binding protein